MANRHASAVILDTACVVIEGASGAGKSTLAMSLVESWQVRGRFARLVCDDQVWLEAVHGRLVCRVIATIAGLVEVRGVGPVPAEYEPAGIVELVVRLTEPENLVRLPDADTVTLEGVTIPAIDVASRNAVTARQAIEARLAIVRGGFDPLSTR